MNTEKVSTELVDWLRAEVEQAGAEGLVFGLSGGIDSATVASLARRAFPEDHLALILPVASDPRDREDAGLVVEQFGLRREVIDLTPAFHGLAELFGVDVDRVEPGDIAVSNIKPRLRMLTLYFHANRLGYLVAGTGNRSELTIGYFTKYGDGGVDLLPLGHLVKRQVRELAAHVGVPQSIIDKPPSAGVWAGQTDESELGFTYEALDRYLREGEASEGLAEEIERRRRANAHKLRIPKMPPPSADA